MKESKNLTPEVDLKMPVDSVGASDVSPPSPETRSPPSKSLANLRPWKPGQSGNLAGRPRIEPRVRRYARKFDRQMCDTLAGIAMDPDVPPSERRRAAMDLIAVGSGRPALVQEIGGRGGEPLPLVNISVGNAGLLSPEAAYSMICRDPSADLSHVVFEAPAPSAAVPVIEPATSGVPTTGKTRAAALKDAEAECTLWQKLGTAEKL